jgi:hypothetical protein
MSKHANPKQRLIEIIKQYKCMGGKVMLLENERNLVVEYG